MGTAYIIVSVIPILLLVYIWYLDRLEHEPWGLVAGVFAASALLGTFSAALLEEVGGMLLGQTPLGEIPIFSDFIYFFIKLFFVFFRYFYFSIFTKFKIRIKSMKITC